MSDSFKGRVVFAAHDDAAAWDVFDHVIKYVARTLEERGGYTARYELTLTDDDGSNIERADVEALRQAEREHHLSPRSVYTRFAQKDGMSAPPDDSNSMELLTARLTMQADADVTARIRASFIRDAVGSQPNVAVDLECASKFVRDGLKAKLNAEADYLARERERASASEAAESPATNGLQTNVFHGTVNVGAIGNSNTVDSIEIVATPAPLARPEVPEAGFGTWIARTWRDHTTSFVITVVATVAAAGIALWLGLTP